MDTVLLQLTAVQGSGMSLSTQTPTMSFGLEGSLVHSHFKYGGLLTAYNTDPLRIQQKPLLSTAAFPSQRAS